MSDSRPSRPRDPNQLAKLIADLTTGESDLRTPEGKDVAAMILGRRGGLKGGPARAESLTKEQRREIARKAATARWGKSRENS